MNEFDLIKRYFSRNPCNGAVRVGVGDDAAIFTPNPDKDFAIAADMLVAGRHFFSDADPFDIGFKSLAVNLSDMAAMGARPVAATLCLSLPVLDEAWLNSFAQGFWSLANRYNLDLVGGDTTSGPLTIAIQVWGELPRGKALLRRGALIGDDIWLSGAIGSAALALQCVLGRYTTNSTNLNASLARLNRPDPRVDLGQSLLKLAHAAIDVSDGLLADLGHIIEASGVGASIDWGSIPLDPMFEGHRNDDGFREIVLAGGDDYELCFTASPEWESSINALAAEHTVRLTKIGRITAGDAIELKGINGEFLPIGRRGFDHFETH